MLIWWLKLAADKECEVDTMEWSDVQAGIRSMQGCEIIQTGWQRQ